jgi:hypothetical protein
MCSSGAEKQRVNLYSSRTSQLTKRMYVCVYHSYLPESSYDRAVKRPYLECNRPNVTIAKQRNARSELKEKRTGTNAAVVQQDRGHRARRRRSHKKPPAKEGRRRKNWRSRAQLFAPTFGGVWVTPERAPVKCLCFERKRER